MMTRDTLETEVAVIKNSLKHVELKVDKIEQKINEFIASADKKYAPRSAVEAIQKAIDKRDDKGREVLWKFITIISSIIAGYIIAYAMSGGFAV